MALPVINNWREYFNNYDEGLGSSYERVVINDLLAKICENYGVKKVLEAPCFGFTGVSGINSMDMANKGLDVTIIDHNGERLGLIENVWEECKIDVQSVFSEKYEYLNFADNSFDLTWNFSSLWFIQNLEKGLEELSRVTSKVMMLIVPNRTGLGYIWQKMTTPATQELKIDWIKPGYFLPIMDKLDWKLIEHKLIDCPPWPDIGMKKEKLLAKFGLESLLDKGDDKGERISILDYYLKNEPDFPEKMRKYSWCERNLPSFIKSFWAHHHYYLFVRKEPVR